MDVAWSPDGRRLAVAARLQVKVLDAATGEGMLILRGLTQMVPNATGFNASARFSPDGKSLVAICNDGLYSIAEWSVEEEPPASGGADVPPTAQRLRAAERRSALRLLWTKESQDRPDSLTFRHNYRYACEAALVSPGEFLKRAQMHARVGRLEAAWADLDRVLERGQGDFWVLNGAGTLEARHARWDKAAAAYAQALAARPDRAYCWFDCADSALARGDHDGFRRHCHGMLRLLARTTNLDEAANVAWRCLLLPAPPNEGEEDRELARRLAEQVVTPPAGNPNYRPFALVKALAEHRAGHFQAADEWLTRGEKHHDPRSEETGEEALLLLCRALVQQRLGRLDDARKALDQAKRIMLKQWPQGDSTPDMKAWWFWAHAHALRGEAEALLKADAAPHSP
jgi:tetratricopeptide (TPR) repeat protein